jgi:hypothetical protein
MDDPDWKEEQRSVLARLFDAAFKRREAPEHEIEAGTVNKHPDVTAHHSSNGSLA